MRNQNIYNCLHYVDYDHKTTIEVLVGTIESAGPYINAIQLDMPWPNPEIVKEVSSGHKELEIIIQIGKNAIEEVDNDPKKVVDRISDYGNAVTRVLIDKSMGRGIKMNTNDLIPFVNEIKESLPNVGIVIAGGFGPKTINLIEPLISKFANLSIDAQGQLRPSGNAIDPIDWNLASEYLSKAVKLLKKDS